MIEWYEELRAACKRHKGNCDICEYNGCCHCDEDEDEDENQ